MTNIERIEAFEVLDSRGIPTVRATVHCEGGVSGTATVPSGASTGEHEAHELRDGDDTRFHGRGVTKAISNITTGIQSALLGKDVTRQADIDAFLIELDGTANKSNLGANALLAVSLACARAGANTKGEPLYHYLHQLGDFELGFPTPQMNLINGGAHASNDLSIQEFHVVPVNGPSFVENLRIGVEVYQALKALFLADGLQVEVGDEGGFAPPLQSTETALTYLVRAIEAADYTPGTDVFLGVDAAASEFYDEVNELYTIDGGPVDAAQLARFYKDWHDRYPLISLEDPFEQNAWADWQAFAKELGQHMQIVGDDLFATNPRLLAKGIEIHAANAALIKLNQIGTLSETLTVIEQAKGANMNVVISHRSGETEDTFIADLAVATGADQIKAGAPARSERTAKYNRLIGIERALEGVSVGHSLAKFKESQSAQAVPDTGMKF